MKININVQRLFVAQAWKRSGRGLVFCQRRDGLDGIDGNSMGTAFLRKSDRRSIVCVTLIGLGGGAPGSPSLARRRGGCGIFCVTLVGTSSLWASPVYMFDPRHIAGAF
jgi:hypothetical protein